MPRKINTFRAQLEDELDKVDEKEKEVFATTVRATYTYIIEEWPTYSYFSQANHRINITGRRVMRVEPDESNRPDMKGALAGKAAAVHAAQLAKVDKLTTGTRGRSVVIGNAVSYAPDVGDVPGGSGYPGYGNKIYLEAADFGRAVGRLKAKT